MVNNSWPIAPQWLSIREGLKESEVDPNFDGLFKSDLLRGLLIEVSYNQDINSPISLFQIIPSKADFIYENSNNTITKIDATIPFLKNIINDRRVIRIDAVRSSDNIKCCDLFGRNRVGVDCFQKCNDLDSRGSVHKIV